MFDRAYDNLSIKTHNVCFHRLRLSDHETKRKADNLIYRFVDGAYNIRYELVTAETPFIGAGNSFERYKAERLAE